MISRNYRATSVLIKQCFSKKTMLYHRYNPYNQQVIYEGHYMNQTEIAKVIQNSTSQQITWAAQRVEDRVFLIEKFLDLLERDKNRIALMITQSMGKPKYQAMKEIDTALFVSRRLLKLVPNYVQDIEKSASRSIKITYEPIGISLQFAPWNWPILYTVIELIPALVGGNTVILKHSYMTPMIGKEIHSLFQSLGFGDLVINIELENELLRNLIGHPEIGYVSFIGGYATGMKIYEDASYQQMIEVGLRFTGKDGAVFMIFIFEKYIRADADLEQAAKVIMESSLENGGQTDLAVKRIYINSERIVEFEDIFLKLVQETYIIGDPEQETTTLGPLAEPENELTLSKQTEDAVIQGARVLCGGMQCQDPNSPDAHFFEPTIITDVENDMSIMQEVSMGPIVTISSVQDDEEAVRLLNDSKFGNAVSIFTTDYKALRQLASKVDVGQVYGNHCNYYDCVELPHDPRKESGRGIILSKYAFKNYVRPKSHNYQFSLK